MEEEGEKYKKAKSRVEELKGFYSHLITYIAVNIMLLVINLVTSPNHLWFYWVTVVWGIGLIWHAISVYGKFGKKKGREEDKRNHGNGGKKMMNATIGGQLNV